MKREPLDTDLLQALLTGQQVLLDEVRALRRLLEPERAALCAEDREALALLVPEISAAVGDAQWTAGDLLEHAGDDSELRQAITHAIGPLDSGSSRRLGKLLARGAGHDLGIGYRVVRGSLSDGVVLWRVHAES